MFLSLLGDVGQFALPIGVGIHAAYKGFYKETAGFGIAAGVQQIVLNILKKNIHAPRPFPNNMRFDSFPSGHTAGAFLSVGFFLALELATQETNPVERISLVALAVLVGVSRVVALKHWPIDVVAGAFLGLFFGAIAPLCVQLIQEEKSAGLSKS